MTLKDTIERFAHLDIVLGDPAWCAGSLPWTTAHDLWVAAKAGQAEIDALTERIEIRLRETDAVRENKNQWMRKCNELGDTIQLLQERNAFLLTSAETAQAKLAEARAEVEKLTHSLAISNAIAAGKPIQYVGPLEGMKESLEASYRSALDESARQIGQMKQWLSEASAQNQKTSRELAECRKQCETIAVMRNLEVQPELADALGRISTLEAEVQRLENARWDQG